MRPFQLIVGDMHKLSTNSLSNDIKGRTLFNVFDEYFFLKINVIKDILVISQGVCYGI